MRTASRSPLAPLAPIAQAVQKGARKTHRAVVFLRRTLRKANGDGLGMVSSALAFSSILSLVPLFALTSRFVARAITADNGRTIGVLAHLLPYSEKTLVTAIDAFVAQAEALSGLAMIGFLVSCASTFLTIEEAIDKIFKVERRKILVLRRLFSFSLVVVWGPLAIAGLVALLIHLAQDPAFSHFLRRSTIARWLPPAITLLGLTVLFWFVPNRKVRLRNAFAGSAVATLALHGLQTGFRAYVRLFTAASRVVYGSFAIAFFFMISLQIAWWLVLVGCEVAASLELGEEGEAGIGSAPVARPARDSSDVRPAAPPTSTLPRAQ